MVCNVKGIKEDSLGESSILLNEINKKFSGFKRNDGGSNLYDLIYTSRFHKFLGGDFTFKKEGEPGYDEFLKVKDLYKNKMHLFTKQGEPRLYLDGTSAYFLNYKGDRFNILEQKDINEQDRLDIINSISYQLISNDLYDISDDKTIKESIEKVFNAKKATLMAYLDEHEEYVDGDNLSDEELESKKYEDAVIEYTNVENEVITINRLLNSSYIMDSIVAGVKNNTRGLEINYDIMENLDNNGENNSSDSLGSSTDVSAHIKEATSVRDTSTIDSEVAMLLNSVLLADENGNQVNSRVLGLPLTYSKNVVKNRLMENIANIIDIQLENNVAIIDPYTQIMEVLNKRAEEFDDKILKGFLSNLKNTYDKKSKQDKEAFQVRFFKSFSKGAHNFIITEFKNYSSKDKARYKISFMNPEKINGKSQKISRELFLQASFNIKKLTSVKLDGTRDYTETELFNEIFTLGNKILEGTSKRDPETKKMVHTYKYSETDRKNFFKQALNLLGIKVTDQTIDHLYVHDGKKDTGFMYDYSFNELVNSLLGINNGNYPGEGMRLMVEDKDKVSNILLSYKVALVDYQKTNDKDKKNAIMNSIIDPKFNNAFMMLANVEAMFRPQLADSNLNFAGKSQWKYTLMNGVNKQLLRWKAGDIRTLEMHSHKGLPYVDYLLAKDIKGTPEQIAEVKKKRIDAVQLTTFSQLRNNDNVEEFKNIGDSDLHLDSMVKLLGSKDEIWDTLKKIQRKSQLIDDYMSQNPLDIQPATHASADKGSAYGFTGLRKGLIPGFTKESQLDDIAKKQIKNMFLGELETMKRHSALIQGYYNPKFTPEQRHNYLLTRLISGIHYDPNYSVNGVKYDISKPESEINRLNAEAFNRGLWNAFGFFNGSYLNNKKDFDKIFKKLRVSNGELQVLNEADIAEMIEKLNEKEESDLYEILYDDVTAIIEDDAIKLKETLGDTLYSIETNITDSNTDSMVKTYLLNAMLNNMQLFTMFNGDINMYKQARGAHDTKSLSLDDALKRAPAPMTDGLQAFISEQFLTLGNTHFKPYEKQGLSENYKNLYGEDVAVNRNTHTVIAVVDNLELDSSAYVNQIKKGLGVEHIDKNYGGELADAGAWMTLDFYKKIMMQYQGWTERDEQMFNELQDPKTVLTSTHYKWLKISGHALDPKKLVGHELVPLLDDQGNVVGSYSQFLKYAPVILVPGLIKGTELDKVNKQMISQGVDQLIFKSGSKASNIATTNIHELNEDGSFKGIKDDFKLNPSTFGLTSLKWQVELPSHFFSEANIGTQHLKNLLGNFAVDENGNLDDVTKSYPYKGRWLTAKQMFKIYNDIVVDILTNQLKDFTKKYGIKIDELGNIDYKNDSLRQLLIDQLDPSEDFKLIQLLSDHTVPLETIPNAAQRLFPVLAGAVKKQVGKVSTNTAAMIQVANIGYDHLNDKDKSDILFLKQDVKLTPPKPIVLTDLKIKEFKKLNGVTEEQKKDFNKYHTLNISDSITPEQRLEMESLKNKYKDAFVYYYSDQEGNSQASLIGDDLELGNGKGKLKINKAKVMMPYTTLQKELGISWEEFKEKFNRGEIDMRIFNNIISYRIPNQSISSNDAMEVVGILPPQSGDKVIVYHEITTKAGSDFDVDKLYMMVPSYEIDEETGKVSYSESGVKGKQNDLIEAMSAILQSPVTYDDLISPLDGDQYVKDPIYEVLYEYYLQEKGISNSKIPVTKIISGAQTGVDTIGLKIGKNLNLETGGTAPLNFEREQGYDDEDVRTYGVKAISVKHQNEYTARTGKTDPFTARTERNVINSDGTVYFEVEGDGKGMHATKRAAKDHNKPFLLNPTTSQLREWLKTNNIKVLNVAGNRGSKLTKEQSDKIQNILEEALSPIDKADAMSFDAFKDARKPSPMSQMGAVRTVNSRVDMLKAKGLVATMANHMTDVPMSQIMKSEVLVNLGFGNNELYKQFVGDNEGDNNWKTTKMVSYFMNAAVDAAKDNYIIDGNFITYTSGAAMILIRSGMLPKDVFRLLLHPEIKKISTIKTKNTELTSGVELKDYGYKKSDEDNLIKEFLLEYGDKLKQGKLAETTADLLKNINAVENPKMLKGLWFLLVEAGKELSNDISISKFDSSGAGKNIFEHMALFNRMERGKRSVIGRKEGENNLMLNKLYYNGINKKDADNHTFRFINPLNPKDKQEFANFTMLGAIMNNTMMLTNSIAKNMFIEATDNYRLLVNKISQLSGKPLETNADNLKSISKMLYPIVLATSDHELYSDDYTSQLALVEGLTNGNTVISSSMKDRVYTMKTIPLFKDNKFIQMLTYNEKTNLIEFPNIGQLDPRDKNEIANDFEKLYKAHENYYKLLLNNNGTALEAVAMIKQFAVDMIKYSFLATGFKPSVTSFNDYLPMGYFIDTNHAGAVESILNRFNSNMTNADIATIIDNAMTMYATNNPNDYKYVRKIDKPIKALVTKKYLNIFNIENGEEFKLGETIMNANTGKPYPYIKVGKDRFVLYKLISVNENNEPMYHQIMTPRTSKLDTDHKFLYTSLYSSRNQTSGVKRYMIDENLTPSNFKEAPIFSLPEMLLPADDKPVYYKSRIDELMEAAGITNTSDNSENIVSLLYKKLPNFNKQQIDKAIEELGLDNFEENLNDPVILAELIMKCHL